MKRLYVLYDGQCEFCRRIRFWLGRQATYVPITFLPLQSEEVAARFPGVESFRPEQEIVVISDEGAVWQGGHAWITVLWTLREYREWAQRLAHPALVPMARRVCTLVSENRYALSKWFTAGGAREVQAQLATLPEPACRPHDRCARPLTTT